MHCRLAASRHEATVPHAWGVSTPPGTATPTAVGAAPGLCSPSSVAPVNAACVVSPLQVWVSAHPHIQAASHGVFTLVMVKIGAC